MLPLKLDNPRHVTYIVLNPQSDHRRDQMYKCMHLPLNGISSVLKCKDKQLSYKNNG